MAHRTFDRMEAAAAVLAHGGTQEAAANAAGVSTVTIWRWRQDAPDFRRALDAAELAFAAEVEGVAWPSREGAPSADDLAVHRLEEDWAPLMSHRRRREVLGS